MNRDERDDVIEQLAGCIDDREKGLAFRIMQTFSDEQLLVVVEIANASYQEALRPRPGGAA